MKKITRLLFYMFIGATAFLSTSMVASAQEYSRNKITKTVTGTTGNEYVISYYDKVYYDGSTLQTNELTVKCGEKNIVGHYNEDSDTPSWRYEDNTGGRVITITVTGDENYPDLNFTFSYTFYPYEFDDTYELTYDGNAAQPTMLYTGRAVEPKVVIKTNKWNKEEQNYNLSAMYYKVSYENNVNAGNAKVIAKGIGLYSGTLELPFTISGFSISGYEVKQFLNGKTQALIEGIDPSYYVLDIVDKDRDVAELKIVDDMVGNYYFSEIDRATGKTVDCTALRIENYNEQWDYKAYPDGYVIGEDGNTDTKVCPTHTLKRVYYSSPASCLYDGQEEVFACKVCGRYFKDENALEEIKHLNDTVIPATGHKFGVWEVVREADSREEGLMKQECANCHTYNYKIIPKTESGSSSGGNSSSGGSSSSGGNTSSGGNSSSESSLSSGDSSSSASGSSSGSDKNESDDDSANVVKVGKVSSYKLVSKKKKQLTLTWKKTSGADGYEIQYGTDKKFKKIKSKKVSNKKITLTIKKLKSNKKYYVRIRAYRKYKDENGDTKTVYGTWSTKNKKCK